MTDDLEQRVRRWLQREATEGAPAALRHRLAATELPADRANRWLAMPRLALVVGTVALALIVTVTAVLLAGQQRRVGAYSCDSTLIAHVEDAIAHAAGYAVDGSGTVVALTIPFDTEHPGATTDADLTVRLEFLAPHDALLSAHSPTQIAATLPAGLQGNGTITRVGGEVRFSSDGGQGSVQTLPQGADPDLAAPNPLTRILPEAVVSRLDWTAFADAGRCRLTGRPSPEAATPDYTMSLELLVDLRTAHVLQIHDTQNATAPTPSPGETSFEQSWGWDMTYTVDWSARPQIKLPPLPSTLGVSTPSPMAYVCAPQLLETVHQSLSNTDGYVADGSGQGSVNQPVFDPSAPGNTAWQTTMVPVTVHFAMLGPDSVDISTTTEPAGPPVQFGILSFIGIHELVRVGDAVRWVHWDGSVTDAPIDMNRNASTGDFAANPLLSLLVDPTADHPFSWTAQQTDATTCRLTGVIDIAEPTGTIAREERDVLVDLQTGQPTLLHEVHESQPDVSQPDTRWDITYTVNTSARPQISLPPLATPVPAAQPPGTPGPS